MRTLKSSTESNLRRTIGPSHPIMPWFIEHAAQLKNRHMVGADGRTSGSGSHTLCAARELSSCGSTSCCYQVLVAVGGIVEERRQARAPLLVTVVLGRNWPVARARDSARTRRVVGRPGHGASGRSAQVDRLFVLVMEHSIERRGSKARSPCGASPQWRFCQLWPLNRNSLSTDAKDNVVLTMIVKHLELCRAPESIYG